MVGRLHHKVFLSLLGIVVLALTLAALASHALLGDLVRGHMNDKLLALGQGVADGLPGPAATLPELQAAVERAALARTVHIAVWSGEGEKLAFTSFEVPRPVPGQAPRVAMAHGWVPTLTMPLADGRVLVLQPRRPPQRPGAFLAVLLLLAVGLGLGSYPVARRITRRLERLEHGVRELGAGRFGTQVEVRGNDEVASLAASFNAASESLERLESARRRMLAGASHELRSPLARLRLLLELLRQDTAAAPERIDEAAEEIEDLDRLVEDLLLASRLDAARQPLAREETDLLEIVAVEAARVGARAEGRQTLVAVDRRMVRSLVRNLLDNAARHAGAGEVVAGVEPLPGPDGGARVWVADSGPGVPEDERERIFEAFQSGSGAAAASGLGLGLFLVRRIAEAHGGSAVCRPRHGGGTVFEVVLPVAG